ncbi:GntR family transcriptional regulator [Jeotgalibaca caeni]|uniref:GntR family transcriptional regulator n=1 Tax=Jeotgalibaca caeni TaxID=3028623 RepID=UPI00237EB1F1|nr:GntR family transcriptional regulator [Jeotgalibaca caeni]MDE1548637.1 GntR family transcriptional regulator [Jeotgalibaca caeni]
MNIIKEPIGGSAREFSLRVIKEKLISLEIKPNTMMSEKEIASELNLSRTPIREAMIELSKSQIIQIIPQKGCYVPKIDYNLVNESRFIRLQLEKGIIEELCNRNQEIDFSELEENLKLQAFFVEQEDIDRFFEMDNLFHKQFFILTGKLQTYQLTETMQIHFDRVRRMKLENVKESKELLQDHEELLEAIKEKNVERALSLIELHLSRYQIDKQKIQEKYGSYFELDN